MSQTIQAVFEDGVLRPLERLDLEEQTRVQITIEAVTAPSLSSGNEIEDPLAGLRVKTGLPDLAEQFDEYRFGRRTP